MHPDWHNSVPLRIARGIWYQEDADATPPVSTAFPQGVDPIVSCTHSETGHSIPHHVWTWYLLSGDGPIGHNVDVQRVTLSGEIAPMTGRSDHGGVIRAELDRRHAHLDLGSGKEGSPQGAIG